MEMVVFVFYGSKLVSKLDTRLSVRIFTFLSYTLNSQVLMLSL